MQADLCVKSPNSVFVAMQVRSLTNTEAGATFMGNVRGRDPSIAYQKARQRLQVNFHKGSHAASNPLHSSGWLQSSRPNQHAWYLPQTHAHGMPQAAMVRHSVIAGLDLDGQG